MKTHLWFMRSGSVISRAVRFVTWGEYSHVALQTPERTVIESMDGIGVREFPIGIDYCGLPYKNGTVVDVYEFKQIIPKSLINSIRAEVGKKYDMWGVFSFLLRKKMQEPDRWFCSELIAKKFEQAGLPLLNLPAYKIDPSLLAATPYIKYTGTFTVNDECADWRSPVANSQPVLA